LQCLDACPLAVDVIQHFVNCSWQFMDAYQKGLTGKAAAWAVKKQKGHCVVSQQAYMQLEAVLNQIGLKFPMYINLPKIWQIPKCCGKNFRWCFSDVFKVTESESEVSLSQKTLFPPILGFVDFDCPQMYIGINSQEMTVTNYTGELHKYLKTLIMAIRAPPACLVETQSSSWRSEYLFLPSYKSEVYVGVVLLIQLFSQKCNAHFLSWD